MVDHDARPLLLIAMGTSGSGKSTFGTRLAQSLSIPFIDGDDLHPTNNVEKMSRGEALTDEDRMPWLQAIREKAMQVTHPNASQSISQREASSKDEPLKEEMKVREMAERLETSRIDQQGDKSLEGKQAGKTENYSHTSGSLSKACVIACSALKKSYRDLLRGGPSSDLHVVHIYLQIDANELRRRMHERKGHFMKESMLQSQLATLEEPLGEVDTIIVHDDKLDHQVNQARKELEAMLQ